MRIAVRPFGVLGTRLTANGIVHKVAQGPVPGLPIIDPTSLPTMQNGPRGAGGAAGEIYKYSAFRRMPRFLSLFLRPSKPPDRPNSTITA